jgi:hypothetical protein
MTDKVKHALQSPVFKAGPRRLRMPQPPTPKPAPKRKMSDFAKESDKNKG